MSTTIQVTKQLAARLKKLKEDTGGKSIDSVITALLEEQQEQEEAHVVEDLDQEEGDAPAKRRKIDVRDALYSLEWLTERRGMLEFCTGFDRPAVDLLIRRFREVSRSGFVFLHCCRSGIHGCVDVLLHHIEQVIASDQPERRQSNGGFRRLDLPERVVLFLTRIRRKATFQELGYQYGCGRDSAIRYYDELVKIFNEHFVPRLVFPRSPAELKKMTRAEVAEVFSDLLAILDATNWEQCKPENFLFNRLSYSAYKHGNVYQVLLGEFLYWVTSDLLT